MTEPWLGGEARYDNTRNLGGFDMAGDRVPRGDPRWTHQMAGAAEYLVSLFLGVPFDFRINAPDPGYDFILPDGRKVDVKWTPRADGKLLCALDARSVGVADLYILVTGDDPKSLVIRGYATSAELLSSVIHINDKRGDSYGLPQSALHPIEELA